MQAYYSIIEGIPMDILIHSCSHSVDRGKKKKKKKNMVLNKMSMT